MARLIWNSGTQEKGTAKNLTAKGAKNAKKKGFRFRRR
jgi:hypothetical protein